VTSQVWQHKKFQVGIVTTLSLLFGILGPAMVEAATFWQALGAITPEEWLLIIGPILAAIGFQGFADWGKEAAKIKEAGNGQ